MEHTEVPCQITGLAVGVDHLMDAIAYVQTIQIMQPDLRLNVYANHPSGAVVVEAAILWGMAPVASSCVHRDAVTAYVCGALALSDAVVER